MLDINDLFRNKKMQFVETVKLFIYLFISIFFQKLAKIFQNT